MSDTKKPATGHVHVFPERTLLGEQASQDVADPEHSVHGRVHGSQAWLLFVLTKYPAVGQVQVFPERVQPEGQAVHVEVVVEHSVQGKVQDSHALPFEELMKNPAGQLQIFVERV